MISSMRILFFTELFAGRGARRKKAASLGICLTIATDFKNLMLSLILWLFDLMDISD